MAREDDFNDRPLGAAEAAAVDRALASLVAAERAAAPALPKGLAERVIADARRFCEEGAGDEAPLSAVVPSGRSVRNGTASNGAADGDMLWVRGGALAASLILGVALGLSGSLPTGNPSVIVADLMPVEDVALAAADGFFGADAPF